MQSRVQSYVQFPSAKGRPMNRKILSSTLLFLLIPVFAAAQAPQPAPKWAIMKVISGKSRATGERSMGSA